MPVFEFTSPDGKTYEVEGPEGATESQAFQMLQSQLGQQAPAAPEQPAAPVEAPRKRTMTEEFKRQLGLTARAGITGATGISGMLADLPVGVANLFGADLPMPSQEQQRLMSRIGLPEPEGLIEHGAQIGASALAGAKLDPAVAKLSIPRSTKPLTPLQQQQREAMEAGYRVTPRLGAKSKIMSSLESLTGTDRAKAIARARNVEVTDTLVKKALGFPKTAAITDDTLTNLKSQVYDDAYKPIDKLGKITTGGIYRRTLDRIAKEESGSSKSFPEAAKKVVSDLVDKYRVREFDANDAREITRTLRDDAKSLYRAGGPENTHMAKANRRIADAIEDAIELNLKARGEKELMTNFKKGRTDFAKIYEVERALVAPDTIDAVKLAGRLSKKAPLSGELRQVAKFAQQFGPIANKGALGEAPLFQASDAIIGGGIGAITGSIAPVALSGARGAGSYGLMSPAGQWLLKPRTVSQGTNIINKGLYGAYGASPSIFGAD